MEDEEGRNPERIATYNRSVNEAFDRISRGRGFEGD